MLMPYNCAVIGLGQIGCEFDEKLSSSKPLTHTGIILNNKNSNLIALCDVDTNKLKKYGKKFQITNLYSDYNEMFKNENLDCVSICTPPNSHYEITKAACSSSVKGIFLEKPISISLEQSKKIIKLCKSKNIKLQIDHQRRFSSFYHKIKSEINNPKFGSIQSINLHYGAGIINTGTHILDILRFFFGNIKTVKGKFSVNISNRLDDPNVDGTLIFESGLECTLKSFNVKNFGILECDIIGSKGRFQINLANSTTIYSKINNKPGLVYRSLINKPFIVNEESSEIMNGFKNLLFCIKNNTDTMCNGFDGYYSLQSSLSLIKSAKNNSKKINLSKLKL